jgi:hypothetical protein
MPILRSIWINHDNESNTYVGKLLNDMTATSTQADDNDSCFMENCLAKFAYYQTL